MDMKASWDDLHKLPRFRPQYPNEGVVRFLFTNFPTNKEKRKNIKILDLGCGGGRHVKLFAEQGFDISGVDFSKEAITYVKEMLKKLNLSAELQQADMTNLPYEDDSFDGIVSFGVFYYSDSAGAKKAIDELHRVLKKGGKAFINLRSINDCRFGKGRMIEKNTFVLDIEETNEKGMTIHFLSEEDVYTYFSKFQKISLGKNDYTSNILDLLNSDWLITVEK
ncbi:MAG: class I SAM-dependent methyltransferase [Phycisphaerae bacterium]|nr:class I SAM-dependent methyltransferase [Phycisphaerae bacterium]